jgi:hypothetical protein
VAAVAAVEEMGSEAEAAAEAAERVVMVADCAYRVVLVVQREGLGVAAKEGATALAAAVAVRKAVCLEKATRAVGEVGSVGLESQVVM